MKETYPLPQRLAWSAYLALKVRGQRHVPFWGSSRLRKIQNARFRRIINYAARRVPYYRDLFRTRGWEPGDFRTLADISRLPILEPLAVRQNPEIFKPDHKSIDTLALASSGTTGVPREVWHDAVSLFTNAAHGERIRFYYPSGHAFSRNFREALIDPPLGSASREVQRFNRTKAWFPTIARADRRYFSMLDDVDTILEKLNAFQPDVIWSYGSSLNIIFEEIFRRRLKFHRPKAIIFSSDAMSPPIRRKVIDELEIPVYGVYDSIECLQLGFECGEHCGYHMNEDCYPVRVVDDDDQELPDGETGRIIVSNLINRATVLLNYELGDQGRILPERCRCGRTQRMMGLDLSRITDCLDLAGGIKIHPIVFAEAVYNVKGLWQHQAVQRRENEFDLFLVADPSEDRSVMAGQLRKRFQEWFADRINLRIEFVDRIAVGPSGKQRALILLSRK